MRFNPPMIDKQVPHRDQDAVLHPCSQRRKREATAAFLRSFKEALIGDWEHLGERLHLETIRLHLENQREREKDTHTPTHTLRHVTGPMSCFSGYYPSPCVL